MRGDKGFGSSFLPLPSSPLLSVSVPLFETGSYIDRLGLLSTLE